MIYETTLYLSQDKYKWISDKKQRDVRNIK